MKNSQCIVSIALVCASTGVFAANVYPGNPNYRSVPATFAAPTRTDWQTNAVDWAKAERVADGVLYLPVVMTEPDWMYCHFARIDLCAPDIRFTGSDRAEGWGTQMPDWNEAYNINTVREKTGDFLARNRGPKSKGGKARNAVLAFNSAAWGPWVSPYTNKWGCINGPFYADGIQISNAATGWGTHGSSSNPLGLFVVTKDGAADIVPQMTKALAKKTWFCCPAFVHRLVTDGVAHTIGDTSIRPRTAIGISQDKRYVYVLVCDGDSASWSLGARFTPLAQLMVKAGAYQAFNLDGGGSSNMCTWDRANDCPMIMGRPGGGSSQRDNGANCAIYIKAADAFVGDYRYDDMDTLVQDMVDGELPEGEGAVRIAGAATFTKSHPALTRSFTLTSTNAATTSVGWEADVAPTVLSGTRILCSNLVFRAGSRVLSVEAGGVVALGDDVSIDEVRTADSSGFELAGALSAPLTVGCAGATKAGDAFGFSTLTLAAAKASLPYLVPADGLPLVARAEGADGAVTLAWGNIIDFGGTTAKVSRIDGKAEILVSVAGVDPTYADGCRLQLALKSVDGAYETRLLQNLAGAGDYAFDTSAVEDPAFKAGFDYTYEIALVDARGEAVRYAAKTGGSFSFGKAKNWFAAAAEDDSAAGGAWAAKPGLGDGSFSIAEGDEAVFAAGKPRVGVARLTSVVTFEGPVAAIEQEAMLKTLAAEGLPQGAVALTVDDDAETPVWCGLVEQDGVPAWTTLYGPAAFKTPLVIVQEVDISRGLPRISYLVSSSLAEEPVRLHDAGGETWFDGVGPGAQVLGRVAFVGTGSVASFAGEYMRRLSEFVPGFRITIR